jgi:hypothetical protein
MSGEDRIIGKRYSHFLKGNLLDPFHLVIGSSKWFTENCCVLMRFVVFISEKTYNDRQIAFQNNG